MLDSSPISIPPPRRLKRTASVASLPSPPPSVEHPKKRTTTQIFGSDNDSGSDRDVDETTKNGHKVVGRKLLFPAGPSTYNGAEDTAFIGEAKPSNLKEKLSLDADNSRSAHREAAPVLPPSSKRKSIEAFVPSAQTPFVSQRGICSASELPVLDEENNPFLIDSPPKSRRPRSPHDLTEDPTMTYVFKGIKTSVPNPNYNLPESIYDSSRLPFSHPDYSPLPTRAPRCLFPEAYCNVDDVKDEGGDSNAEVEEVGAEMRTPDMKPRMSKLFVDAAGNPLPDSGPQGVRGNTMDARDIGRMAVGPIRGRG